MIHYKGDDWVGEESGHKEYAFSDRLSVDFDGELTYGYDGDFNASRFSLAERLALADFQIARWVKWKETQK